MWVELHSRGAFRRRLAIALSLALAGLLAGLAGLGSAGPATAAATSSCSTPQYPSARDPANPLMLARTPTGGDVLAGARFFTAGPARGTAAGAIAQLFGVDQDEALASGQPLTGFPDSESYATFSAEVDSALEFLPRASQRKVRLLEKIAREPTPLRISNASGGGSPVEVYLQTRKVFCQILQADPGTIPLINTYFLHPELGGCATTAEMYADAGRFVGQVEAMAAAIGSRPVVLFDELDAVGSSACMATRTHSIATWEKLVGFEAAVFESLPHTAVYLEAGYSDANSPAYTARVLRRMDIHGVQGFFTNDTHLQWTSHELRWAQAVSRRLGGVHFVINTASNGRGPLLNPHPRTQGVEDLCNAPGRGLGIPDTTRTRSLSPELDGLLWITTPGNSAGTCRGGPASGTFWTARAETLAANANRQLGPGYPSKPY